MFIKVTTTSEIYTLSLHDALPICPPPPPGPQRRQRHGARPAREPRRAGARRGCPLPDRKSTRLNSSHVEISYAVFCLKKKKKEKKEFRVENYSMIVVEVDNEISG